MIPRLLFLSLAATLASFTPGSAHATDFTDLDACLADPGRVETAFSQRFPHEACTPLSTCDPKLVTSAEVIATRTCRREAIADCAGGDCLDALQRRWADATDRNGTTIRAEIALLNLNALQPLAIRRVERYGGTELSCPDDPDLLQIVLGDAAPEAQACDLYLSLKNLEATEAMTRYLDGLDVQ